MSAFINFNGEILTEHQPLFRSTSRAARFGDALFETMRVFNDRVLFEEQHFQRLFRGLELMQLHLSSAFNREFLRKEIFRLIKKNDLQGHIRVRLSVSRGEGGLLDAPNHQPVFLIECWPIENYEFNQRGLRVEIFGDIRKSMDAFSNLKSANYLPSVMGALFAKNNGIDESLLLNSESRVCDGTISNIFWIKNEQVFTPPLEEGCIAGIMRKYLLDTIHKAGYTVIEKPCAFNVLREADELFLTNVIRGIRWVEKFREAEFENVISRVLFDQLITSIIT